jgi:hypothetical protein
MTYSLYLGGYHAHCLVGSESTNKFYKIKNIMPKSNRLTSARVQRTLSNA